MTFSDLPMVVLEKVVGELKLVERLILRKMSQNLRTLVDSTEVHCKRLFFDFESEKSTVEIGDLEICYRKTNDDRCHVSSEFNKKEHNDKRNFHQVMISDVSTFLKNPKLKTDRIIFRDERAEPLAEIAELLKSLNFQLNVRSIDIFTAGQSFLPIIQSLEPGTLEEISLDPFSYIGSVAPMRTSEEFDDLMETEQWKKAKKLSWEGFPGGFPMEKLLHFKKIQLFDFMFTEENLTMVRDTLLKSANLESGYLGKGYNDDEEDEADSEERIAGILNQNPEFDSKTWRFSIPNSLDQFQLEIREEDYQGYERFLALHINRVSGELNN